MWTCPRCGKKFAKTSQHHACNENDLQDFLKGKSDISVQLFWCFVKRFGKIGAVTIHPAKSMIGIAVRIRMVYVTRLGKDFIDVVFPFDKPYDDNLCFQKIAQVPGTQQFNHHFRMKLEEDLNDEVERFMRLAYERGR